MKKICFVFFLLVLFLSHFFPQNAFATQDQREVEQKLEQNVQIQLDNLDFSTAEGVLQEMEDHEYQLFGSESFLQKVKQILNGDFIQDETSFLN